MKRQWIGALCLVGCSAHAALPTLNLDITHVTVSGISSGGYMANQFHLAQANWVNGAAIIAGGPYYCAQGSIGTALAQCVNKTSDDFSLDTLKQTIAQYQQQGLLAAPEHLKRSRVWLFHGKLDTRVAEPVSTALYEQYKTWIPDSNLRYVNDRQTAHLMPTKNFGGDCKKSESPFIGNCDYDAAGEFISFLFDSVNPPTQSANGQIHPIDQQKLGGEAAASLADSGYLYIPQQCAQGTECKVHISFHGCNQNAQAVEQEFVQHNGLNPWADSNNFVVLYPQTKTSMMLPLNPQGCWDWWGYTGENYATIKGKQTIAVKNMVMSLNDSKYKKD